jgi:transcriptional regulator with XRE-family HTH domain
MTVLADWLAERLPRGEISELARHLGVSRAAVSDWRLGCSVPGQRHLQGIACYFAADPQEVAALAAESRGRPRRERRGWDDRRPDPREVLDYFVRYQERHLGVPPALREVVEALGLSSTSVARGVVKGLVRAGLLCKVGDGSRCYVVRGGRWLPPEGRGDGR